MGSWSYAVMMGCEMPDDPDDLSWMEGEARLRGGEYVDVPWIFEKFKWGRGPRLESDDGNLVLGFVVAGGDRRGVPDLEGAIAFDDFEQRGRYAKSCERARAQWARCANYAAQRGVNMTLVPRLFLVEMEVG